jgi:DivIVA domain-containing protein
MFPVSWKWPWKDARMGWLVVALLILVIGVAIALITARTGSATLPSIASERPEVSLPETGQITSTDLARVRFTQTLRGYAPDEVDDLLERLRAQLEEAEGDPPTNARPARRGG